MGSKLHVCCTSLALASLLIVSPVLAESGGIVGIPPGGGQSSSCSPDTCTDASCTESITAYTGALAEIILNATQPAPTPTPTAENKKCKEYGDANKPHFGCAGGIDPAACKVACDKLQSDKDGCKSTGIPGPNGKENTNCEQACIDKRPLMSNGDLSDCKKCCAAGCRA